MFRITAIVLSLVLVACATEDPPPEPDVARTPLPDFLVVEKEFSRNILYRVTIIYDGKERYLTFLDEECWERASIGQILPVACR